MPFLRIGDAQEKTSNREGKMKKLSVVFLSLVLALGLCGCKSAEEPAYASDELFDIGMWIGIPDVIDSFDENGEKIEGQSKPMSDEDFLLHYQEIADAGFTVAFPGYTQMLNPSANYNAKALKAAHTVGIKQIIADNTIRDLLTNGKNRVDTGTTTEAALVEQVKAIVKNYTDTEYGDALYGFMIKDEPNASFFDELGYGASILKKAAPDLMFYVNLFPVIATGDVLSGGGEPIVYDSYLTQFVSKVKTDYISYDHYPLYGVGNQTSLEESFLYNMDLMKTKINDEGNDRRLWTFLQSISYGLKNRSLRNKADAAFQANSFLAFGGDGIQWFCYACPPENDGATTFGNDALVDREFHKTPTYDYVSAVNHDIQSLMPYYKNFEWKGFMLSDVYNNKNFGYLQKSENLITADKTVKSYESSDDSFMGVFEDKDGRRGYMVVNFTDPAKNLDNQVTLTFKGAKSAIVVKNGEKTVEKLRGGKLTLDMKAGEGHFVIPF